MAVKIHESWFEKLETEFSKPYFKDLKNVLQEEKKEHTIYPKGSEIFNAFNTTPFHQVKVVILGQDPYHGPGQAHGLSFSVKKGIKQPPSLRNIYKELEADLGIQPPSHGELSAWAEQGVLLLNAILTVRAREAASHRGKGWETFTDEVIRILSKEKRHLVFLLWGKFAQSKASLIDSGGEHLILTAAHPSPFSAHNGFFGCKHFSKTNEFLKQHGIEQIDWAIDKESEY